ncbi:MAG: hypothetical protein AB2A00_10240 [Myxococcota bacterium]
MKKLLRILMQAPANLPLSSRYIVGNGLFYMSFAVLTYAWPGMAQTIFQDPPFTAHEEPMLRLVGMTLFVIGWLYFWSGRWGALNVVAASVLGRLAVPFALAPVILSGTLPHLLITFAVLDPLLAVGAWVLLAREPER